MVKLHYQIVLKNRTLLRFYMTLKMTPMLFKSRFIAGLQCPLRLWHQCYNPKLAKSPHLVQQAIFEATFTFDGIRIRVDIF